jgi:hypothetical protein
MLMPFEAQDHGHVEASMADHARTPMSAATRRRHSSPFVLPGLESEIVTPGRASGHEQTNR